MIARVRLLVRTRSRRYWRASVLIALLLALAGGTVLGAIDGARRTSSALDRLLGMTLPANGFVQPVGLSDAQFAQLRRMPEIEKSAALQAMAMSPVARGDTYLPIAAAIDDHWGRDIDRPHIVRGRAVRLDAPFEVVLGEARAKQFGVDVGSRLGMVSYTPAQQQAMARGGDPGRAAGPKFSLHVVGIERAPRHLNSAQQINDLVILTHAFWLREHDRIGTWGRVLEVRVRPENTRRFTDRVKQTPGFENVVVQFATGQRIQEPLDVASRALLLFALLAGAAGLVVFVLVVSRRLALDTADDETLSALGLARADRRLAGFLELVPSVILGALGAVVVAAVATTWMPFGFAHRVDPAHGFRLEPMLLAAGGGAVAILAAAVVALISWRVIGRRERVQSRASFPARVAEWSAVPLFFGAALRLGFDRGVGKRAVPVGTALVATIVAVAGSSAALLYGASLQRMIDRPAAHGWTWDVVAHDPQDGKLLLDDGDVRDVTQIRVAPISINNRPTEARGISTLRGSDPDLVIRGRAPTTADEVALGAHTMRDLHVDVGDTIHAAGRSGERDFRVVGQALFAGVSDDPQLADGALMREAALGRIYRDVKGNSADASNDQSFTSFLVSFRSDVNATGAARALDATLKRAGGSDSGVTLAKTPEELDRLRDVRTLPLLLAAFVALLGVIGVGYALRTTVARRRVDLALHKTFGMTRRSVGGIVFTQATITVLIGVAFGIPLGFAAARAAWNIEADHLGTVTVVAKPILLLAVCYAAALLVANLVAALPAISAARTRPAAILRSE